MRLDSSSRVSAGVEHSASDSPLTKSAGVCSGSSGPSCARQAVQERLSRCVNMGAGYLEDAAEAAAHTQTDEVSGRAVERKGPCWRSSLRPRVKFQTATCNRQTSFALCTGRFEGSRTESVGAAASSPGLGLLSSGAGSCKPSRPSRSGWQGLIRSSRTRCKYMKGTCAATAVAAPAEGMTKTRSQQRCPCTFWPLPPRPWRRCRCLQQVCRPYLTRLALEPLSALLRFGLCIRRRSCCPKLMYAVNIQHRIVMACTSPASTQRSMPLAYGLVAHASSAFSYMRCLRPSCTPSLPAGEVPVCTLPGRKHAAGIHSLGCRREGIARICTLEDLQ